MTSLLLVALVVIAYAAAATDGAGHGVRADGGAGSAYARRVVGPEGESWSAARPSAPQPDGDRLYWGAWLSGAVYGRREAAFDPGTLAPFEDHAAKRVSLVHMGGSWRRDGRMQPFPAQALERVWKHGSLAVQNWNPWVPGRGVDQPDFRLRKIAGGRYDRYIRAWATSAKRWGHPLFLRPMAEMNGNWRPWSEARNGNADGDFVKAWRHIRRIFDTVGANRVAFVWCPNVEHPSSLKPLSSLYPGDDYVDWTCLDGFNWGGPGWRSFETTFASGYDLITGSIAPSTPFMIGSTGSVERGGSKADWIREMFRVLPERFPRVKALVWFNSIGENRGWQIETSPSAQAAFSAGIAAPRFAANTFGAQSRPRAAR